MKEGISRMKTLKTMFLVVLLAGSLLVHGQGKLRKTKIDKSISMKLPAEFIPMSEDDMWQRASSYRKPIALYTDNNRSSELSINHAFSRWEEGDIVMLQSMYKASIRQLFDKIQFIKEEIQNINGRDFAVFEFVSSIKGDPSLLGQQDSVVKYYYIQYTIEQGGTLVFNFSCQNWVREEWAPIVELMMASVKIN